MGILEGLLGMVLLGGCVFAKLAENDFDLDKIADEQMRKQDELIDKKFKEAEEKFKNL